MSDRAKLAADRRAAGHLSLCAEDRGRQEEEWHVQARNVDSKKEELSKEQWRFIRDHVQATERTHAMIWAEFENLKNAQVQQHAAADRREKLWNETFETELSGIRRSLEEERTRWNQVERASVALKDQLAQDAASFHTHQQHTEHSISIVKKDSKTQHDLLLERVASLENRLAGELSKAASETEEWRVKQLHANRENLEAVKGLHETHKGAMQDMMELEKAAREEAVNDLQRHFLRRLGDEKAARDSHHTYFQDIINSRFSEEKTDRDSRLRGLAEQLSGERAKRERHMTDVQDALDSHAKLHDAQVSELRSIVNVERSSREQHQAHIHALLSSEEASREAHQALVHEHIDHHKNTIQEERSAREAHGHTVQATLSEMRGTLESHSRDRDEHKKYIVEKIDALRRELTDQIKGDEAARKEKIDALRRELTDQIKGDEAARKEKIDALRRELTDQIKGEEAARKAAISEMEDVLGGERIVREDSESAMQDQLHTERAQRELHAGKLEEQLHAERAQRELHKGKLEELQGHVEEAIENERQVRAAQLANVHERHENHRDLVRQELQGHAEAHRAAMENEREARATLMTDIHQHLDEHKGVIREEFRGIRDDHRSAIEHERQVREGGLAEVRAAVHSHRALFDEERTLMQEHQAHTQNRLSHLDGAHATLNTDFKDITGRHLEHVETISEKIANFERRLHEEIGRESEARRADMGVLRELIGGERLALEGHRTTVEQTLERERQARESHLSKLQGSLQTHGGVVEEERAKREKHQSSIQERLVYIEQILQDSAQKHSMMVRDHQGTQSKNQDHIQTIQDKLNTLQQRVSEEVAKEARIREQEMQHFKDLVTREATARATDVSYIQETASTERQAMESKLDSIQEALRTEIAAGDFTSQKRVDVLDRSLGDAVAKTAMVADVQKQQSVQLTSHVEAMIREKAARESAHKSLYDILVQQGDGNQAKGQDRSDVSRDLTSVMESMQKMRNIFEELLRAEREERHEENTRVWKALADHTHDITDDAAPGVSILPTFQASSKTKPPTPSGPSSPPLMTRQSPGGSAVQRSVVMPGSMAGSPTQSTRAPPAWISVGGTRVSSPTPRGTSMVGISSPPCGSPPLGNLSPRVSQTKMIAPLVSAPGDGRTTMLKHSSSMKTYSFPSQQPQPQQLTWQETTPWQEPVASPQTFVHAKEPVAAPQTFVHAKVMSNGGGAQSPEGGTSTSSLRHMKCSGPRFAHGQTVPAEMD
eukprot:TRINITY_DN4031_c0_g1_i1.p1 TRINITY_DN4031_c0_g1~~TRINITY_DN4031_c0_g1_i1.p1  ORF type:complete len:1284 (+),score=268.74 TRINITY_DN4031_c0_g1_i1:138-3854(+)